MTDWYTLRIHDHTEQREQLMLHLLDTFNSLQHEGWIERFFLQRHWLQGPHVKVHYQTAEVPRAVQGRVQPAVLGWFQQPRPADTLTEEVYLQRYHEVARWELIDQPLLPLFPSGTVVWEPCTFRSHRFGTPTVGRLVKHTLADAQPCLQWLLEASAAEKLLRAFQLMAGFTFALASRLPAGGVEEVGTCFFSHAEAFYHNLPGGDALRSKFVGKQQQYSTLLLQLTSDALDGKPEPVQHWKNLLLHHYDQAMEAEKIGELRLSDIETFDVERQRMPEGITPKEFSSSKYHTCYQDPTHPIHETIKQPEFKARRLLVNAMYELLLAGGIRASERLLLCQMVYTTLQSWLNTREVAG